jgi:hypothetical protein
MFLADLQMSPATDDGLFKLAHDLEGVTEVARGLGLSQSIAHRSCQGQVMLVILHCFHIVAHIKICVTQLAINGRKGPKKKRQNYGDYGDTTAVIFGILLLLAVTLLSVFSRIFLN